MRNPYIEVAQDARNTMLGALEDELTPEQEKQEWEKMRGNAKAAGRHIEKQVKRGRWKPEEAEQRFTEYVEQMEKGRGERGA